MFTCIPINRTKPEEEPVHISLFDLNSQAKLNVEQNHNN